ncbi:nSTAND1 domain-containing NTPase [Streptomyces sp. B21-083]|uniref:nSTAND1 domain-containing NTPase n=1 Tax=Streptomyces sp. B21-083 TaxID=3039410 RepID=UPI002FF16092
MATDPGALQCSLPMLSRALLETWHRRRGRTLTRAAYETVGGKAELRVCQCGGLVRLRQQELVGSRSMRALRDPVGAGRE